MIAPGNPNDGEDTNGDGSESPERPPNGDKSRPTYKQEGVAGPVEAPPNQAPETETGSGARNARAASGLTETRDARLEQMAVRRGWVQSQRFPTRKPILELAEEVKAKGGAATLVERVTLSVAEGIIAGSERRKGICERTAVVMERMNQADDHRVAGETIRHEHSGSVTVEQRRNRLLEIVNSIRQRSGVGGNSGNTHGAAGFGGLNDAGELCGDGEPGDVENGSAFGSDEQGDNGGDDWFGLE